MRKKITLDEAIINDCGGSKNATSFFRGLSDDAYCGYQACGTMRNHPNLDKMPIH